VGPAIQTANRRPDEVNGEVMNWIESEMRRIDPDAYRDTPGDTPAGAMREATT
jgi:1-acyl-sn-glycerol-3-phosphate acyltransferase